MNVRFIIGIFLAIFLSSPLSAQNVVLSGKVTDAQSGEPLIGVTVYNTDRRTGTTTNSSGQYTITLPSGRALELVFSYVGYASETQNLTLTRDTKLDIQLRQDTQNLREVQVYGTRHNFGVQSSQMSAVAVSADQIKKMPTLLGEVDVLKSLQRLPGVQSSGEGRSGIYVRGGDYDQNLFLMDGITLYNPEHLQGFTSAINAEVMDDVVLYKGAFPARYGSRLSSVVDVSLREGDMERHRLSVTAGMLASRIQAEGPLWKGHTSYNIAARVSYFSAIVKPMLEEVIYDNPGQMNAYSHMRYWDVNAKLTHRFTDSDRLSAVFYMGYDANNATPNESSQQFTYTDKGGGVSGKDKNSIIDNMRLNRTLNSWNNLLGGLNYTHQFNPSLKLDAGLSYSGYDYRLTYTASATNQIEIDLWGQGREGKAELYYLQRSENSSTYRSEVSDLAFKADLNYILHDSHDIHVGLHAGSIRMRPEIGGTYFTYTKRAKNEGIVSQIGLGEERYTEAETLKDNLLINRQTVGTLAAYAEDDWEINAWFKANVGLRLQGYNADGKTSLALEPRASLRLSLGKGTSVKAAYAHMSQGTFLLSSGSLTRPSEIWIPLTRHMEIGTSDQISLGFGHEMKSGIQFSVEGYYKWLDGVVDYSEGVSYLGMKSWNELIVQGKGKAYGVELLVQKTLGSTTGQVSYTWSKSLRTFDREGMVLNGGREFYAPGDRRHNFSISITQRLSKNWDLSAAWTYQSGRRASFATTTIPGSVLDEFNSYAVYAATSDDTYEANPAYAAKVEDYYETTYIAHLVRTNTYGQRNSYVLPDVHRLDLSLSHHGSIGIGEMICDISIYNLYCQQNISSVYWGFENNRRALKGVCMFPIMPSISLTLKL
ncbi:MAG: carboxypeptidase-like regulatory domain-containing protein [Bacteroidales bacterium]|nr:carboxypeptidase-like regulatory domain-containing protein [Bacteroidales bacterium]